MRPALDPRMLVAIGLLVASACRADPGVVLTGQKTLSMTLISVNGKTSVTLELVLDKDTAVEVVTDDEKVAEKFQAAIKSRLAEQGTRHKGLLKLRQEAAEKKDVKKVEDIDKECMELLRQMKAGLTQTPAVAEGVLRFKDKKWRLDGTMRPFEAGEKDKGRKFGSCTIRGEAVSGEFKAGGATSGLAIRSGETAVVVTGPAAKDRVKGVVRATGTLRLGKGGEASLDAAKVEPEGK